MSPLREQLVALVPREWSTDQACVAIEALYDAIDAIFDVHGNAIADSAIAELDEPPFDSPFDDDIPY